MRAMRVRWLGLAVVVTILAGIGANRLAEPWNYLLLGMALALGCLALVQEVRRARS